jgi:hypothetical protein
MTICIGVVALLLFLVVPGRASTAKQMSAEDIFQLVSTALAGDDNDEACARRIEAIELSEQLSGDAIQVLKAEGAGPLTLQALDELQARSADLPPPAEPVIIAEASPTPERQQEMLTKITDYALGYLSTLPNMSCTETTRFSSYGTASDLAGSRKGRENSPDGWRLEDTVVEDVDYAEGVETYRTRTLNGAPEDRPVTDIRGSYSRGEFGSVLQVTFAPASQTRFQWDHWERLRRQRVAVFSYSIDRAHSHYWVCCNSMGSMTINGVRREQRQTWTSAYRGYVYADADTGIIVRFTLRNVDIPPDYNMVDARNLLDYSPVTLAGQQFWLPVSGIHYSRSATGRRRLTSKKLGHPPDSPSRWRDEIQFSNYRRLGAESTITFPTEEK